jgi:hypothetical protein
MTFSHAGLFSSTAVMSSPSLEIVCYRNRGKPHVAHEQSLRAADAPAIVGDRLASLRLWSTGCGIFCRRFTSSLALFEVFEFQFELVDFGVQRLGRVTKLHLAELVQLRLVRPD